MNVEGTVNGIKNISDEAAAKALTPLLLVAIRTMGKIRKILVRGLRSLPAAPYQGRRDSRPSLDHVLNQRDQNTFLHRTSLQHLDELYEYASILTRNDRDARHLLHKTFLFAKMSGGELCLSRKSRLALFALLRETFRGEEQKRNVADDNGSSNGETRRADVLSAIQLLPQSYRELVALHDFHAFAYQEIAALLNCTVDEVARDLWQARDKVSQLLLRARN